MASFDLVRENIRTVIIPELTKRDRDWLHINLADEGLGKSTLTLDILREFNPSLTPKQCMPFDMGDFFKMLYNAEKGSKTFIFIDEATRFFKHPNSD